MFKNSFVCGSFVVIAVTLLLQACNPAPQQSETPAPKAMPQKNLNLHVASPDWRDQIIYFLMIDRFNDGDPANNDQGFGEYDPTRESHYNGGDIRGITQKLDYIKNLGATSVWLTPPVANQWWSNASSYSGYHGYWARDFKKLDEHYGSLQDYQRLSHELHQRGMYLIQDIVVNHTGIFFGYEGEYDPSDTSKNFVLLEEGHQAAPDMAPFNMVDRNNPEHAAEGIYNWTPPASDYLSDEQQFTYQLGNLSDINTKNPQVLAAFKDAYKHWMQEVGVDAFRIDTVKYVEHEFWHQFLHDDDGIYAKAKSLGKDHFLTFGEVFDSSKPFEDKGEKKVTRFLGTPDKPELNSVIGFPLYFEIGNVLGEGKPTKQLQYRLEKFMELYPDPFVTPNFIDNHDTKRFLAGASHDAMKQALALLFTIPGIPVIYQGTEQAHEETRQAMFAGGYMSEKDQFDETSDFFQFIQKMAAIRTQNRIFSRGDLTVLYSDEAGPGILAYQRNYQGKTAFILLNTADHSTLLSGLKTGLETNLRAGQKLRALYTNKESDELIVGQDGQLFIELPPRAIAIYLATDEYSQNAVSGADDIVINFDTNLQGEVFEEDIELSGQISFPQENFQQENFQQENWGPGFELRLVLNGNLDNARAFRADKNGNWQTIIPVRNLGETPYSVELYVPELQIVSEKMRFVASVSEAELTSVIEDPSDDAYGLKGSYRQPRQQQSQKQMEILKAEAQAAGANLVLKLTMAQVTDLWAPANQFDNTSFSIFFDFSESQSARSSGAQALPLINARMTGDRDWDLAHVAYGWGNYMYRSDNSSANSMGDKVGIAPKIAVNKELGEITFTYYGEQIGVDSWQDAFIYITTWDITGEGAYREISPSGGEWQFGGGAADSPKILDAAILELRSSK